jgi:tetratricopeptide (TPR) repeat protein
MVAASAQKSRWDSMMADAAKAYQQADYAQAEKLLLAALQEAEKFGEQDPRFAASLNNLAELYRVQAKYAQAEPLYQRALAILEKALGPEHPNVAAVLENYAALLHKLNQDAEADKMEARAQAIRAKHAQEIPQR